MGDLPSSNPGPTLGQIPDITAVNAQAYSPAPALAALQAMTARGQMSASDILQLLSQSEALKSQRSSVNRQVQSDQLAMQNAPAAAQLEGDLIRAKASTLPSATDADISGNQLTAATNKDAFDILPAKKKVEVSNLELQAGQNAVAKSVLPDQATAAQSAAKIQALNSKLHAMAYQQDPSGALDSNLSLFTNLGITPPLREDGSLDADKISEIAVPLKTSMMMWQTPSAKAATELAGKKVGGWDLLMKHSANPGAALSALSNLPDALPANDQQGVLGTLAQIEQTLSPSGPLAEARKLVNDSKLNAVGPQWNQGTVVGEKMAEGKAFLGGSSQKYDAQNRLNTTLASGVLNTIKSFAGSGAGQIRTAEIEWFEKNQPTLKSTPAYWNTWLDRAETDLRQVYEAKAKYLPGAVAEGFTEPPKLPGAPANGAAAPAKYPTVTTQADYLQLKPGDYYIYNGQILQKSAQ